MRHPKILILCTVSALALAACDESKDTEVERAMETVNAIDDSNLSGLMLNAASPSEAVVYFRRASAEKPDRVDLKRGLALSLIRDKQVQASLPVWAQVLAMPDSTEDDKLGYADALIRTGDWDRAEQVLNTIPPTYESFKRYRLEAMVADSNQQWKKADSFYEVALGLTTQPAGVLNNWGYSKLVRGDYKGAERLFFEALSYEPDMFTAKNNIVRARGAQQNYTLPVVQMTQTERAELLYNLGLAAIKQGDLTIGKGLLKEAIDTHPQHYDEAVRSLRALEAQVIQG